MNAQLQLGVTEDGLWVNSGRKKPWTKIMNKLFEIKFQLLDNSVFFYNLALIFVIIPTAKVDGARNPSR